MTRKATIAAAFARAAPSYDAHAGMQREAANLLATRIAGLALPPQPHILELGCGTGFLTHHLAAITSHGLVTDIAPAMVATTRTRIGPRFAYAAMDAEAPSVTRGFDLICANLALQWFEHPEASLRQLASLLRPGGWLAVSTLGPASLAAWRHAVAAQAPPPFWCPDALATAWPDEARLDSETLRVAYPSAHAFLAALRAIGAHTSPQGHEPLSAARLRAAMAKFDQAGPVADYAISFICLRAG